jgi:hypothetical protein
MPAGIAGETLSGGRFSPKRPRLIGPEARKIILLLDVILPRGFDSLKMKQRKSF